jgi:carboxylesterase type B
LKKLKTKIKYILQDPQPLDNHDIVGLYNATEEKPFCMQKNYLFPNPHVMGSEDCLYLYVYRPKVSKKK